MSLSSPGQLLRETYTAESAKIQQHFDATGDGRSVTEQRAALVDRIAIDLFHHRFAQESKPAAKIALVALGGYGRRELFPYSDIDLLFLAADASTELSLKLTITDFTQALWDMRMRVSPSARALPECAIFKSENPEFNISLLDCRFLTGDENLFNELHRQILPTLVSRNRDALRENLADLTRQRHAKYGETVFHLEPNLKNSPGGLRDFHTACWLERINELTGEKQFPLHPNRTSPKLNPEAEQAFDFIAAARCLVHFRQGRDDNALTYELQSVAAELGLGVQPRKPMPPADWMRRYFRHARVIFTLTTQLLDAAVPEKTSLDDRVDEWKSKFENSPFTDRGRRSRRPRTSHSAKQSRATPIVIRSSSPRRPKTQPRNRTRSGIRLRSPRKQCHPNPQCLAAAAANSNRTLRRRRPPRHARPRGPCSHLP